MKHFGTPRWTSPCRWRPAFTSSRFARVICGFLVLIASLLGGCGFVASESKLAGAWQVDLPTPQKIVYTFQANHTYTMRLAPRAGTLQGTWKLSGNLLTMSVTSFAADGITNPMPVVKGLSGQKNMITRLTASSMTWRTGAIGGAMKFKRLKTSAPGGNAPL